MEMKHCPKCNTLADVSETICPKCGYEFEKIPQEDVQGRLTSKKGFEVLKDSFWAILMGFFATFLCLGSVKYFDIKQMKNFTDWLVLVLPMPLIVLTVRNINNVFDEILDLFVSMFGTKKMSVDQNYLYISGTNVLNFGSSKLSFYRISYENIVEAEFYEDHCSIDFVSSEKIKRIEFYYKNPYQAKQTSDFLRKRLGKADAISNENSTQNLQSKNIIKEGYELVEVDSRYFAKQIDDANNVYCPKCFKRTSLFNSCCSNCNHSFADKI